MARPNTARASNAARYAGDGREWRTPRSVFDPLSAEFAFTLDPCCTHESKLCPRYFTEVEDGLAQDWGRERVFMNPPYGRELYAWVRKAREASEAGALVVGLLPASVDLAWFHEDVLGHAEVRFIRGRVRFITGVKHKGGSVPFASIIAIWRPPQYLYANQRSLFAREA